MTMHRSHAYGFLTDASLCIGCKACEVACKQWNNLPADGDGALSGQSYDHTLDLGDTTWRHVAFVERPAIDVDHAVAWLMLSDVCKHCVHAGCMEACPTGAIIRTEFDSVYIQQDVCNGCGYCVPACPFGVPQLGHLGDRTARKCTLCYDRLRGGLQPACATSCPTESIRFGPLTELLEDAHARVATLKERGVARAQVYGDAALGGTGGIGGLNALFVLTDEPETFHLPAQPELPSTRAWPALGAGLAVAGAFTIAAMRIFGKRS